MDINIINEIKQLNIGIVKRLFEINNVDCDIKHPSPLQMQIIEVLRKYNGESICQKDLENELNISKAAISGAIITMEKKGIIERITDNIDNRKNKIILSDYGNEYYDKMLEFLKKVNSEILKDIPDAEIEEFMHIINKMKKNIKKEG